MIFRHAKICEADTILAIYNSAKGGEFCVWDDEYPTMREIEGDLAANTLYVMSDGENIAGVLSVMPENEMDGFNIWRVHDGTQKEIARIAVSPDYRGRGLAGVMVTEIEKILKKNGYRAIHISAAAVNKPALRTYEKLGFEIMGKEHMYGHDYYLIEKLI